MIEYGTLAGLNVPLHGQAVWKLPTAICPMVI